jgi:transcriptional regulator with XRE-family HTH domain
MAMKKQLSPLGEAINSFMKDEAVSWYRLSMLSGVDQGTLSKAKYGKASPTLYTLERVARALNVNVSDIILKAESLTGSN